MLKNIYIVYVLVTDISMLTNIFNKDLNCV